MSKDAGQAAKPVQSRIRSVERSTELTPRAHDEAFDGLRMLSNYRVIYAKVY
jgi:hypothetical protein